MKHFNSVGDMRGTPVVPKLSEVFRYDNTPQKLRDDKGKNQPFEDVYPKMGGFSNVIL